MVVGYEPPAGTFTNSNNDHPDGEVSYGDPGE